MKRIVRNPFFVGLTLALSTLAVSAGIAQSVRQASPAPTQLTAPAPESPRPAAVSSTSFSPIVKKALPAVVNIAATIKSKPGGSTQVPGDLFDFFRGFDLPRPAQPPQKEATGSGVIVSPDGYILTNNHVIDGASEVKVTLSDKRELTGKVVGADPKADLALVKVEATGLATLPFADSSKAEVGDVVLAIGSPFGLGQTVTMGIVSGLSRTNLGIEEYEDFIQTDAAINPGNSGGALIDAAGELIGINTAIFSNGGNGNLGVGFAIPSNMARRIMDDLRNHGRVTRGFLGMRIQPLNPELASAFKLKDTRGVLVGGVEPDGPAAKAGIQSGDVIRSIDGKVVDEPSALRLAVAAVAPGNRVKLGVLRNGAEKEIVATVGALPAEPLASNNTTEQEKTGKIGVGVRDLDAATAKRLGLPPSATGAVIAAIEPGSPAARAGLQEGDLVQEVNRKRVASAEEFREAVSHASQDPILLLVNRGGNTMFVAVNRPS